MLKRELKINLKGFIIWISVLVILYLAVFLVYPSLVSNDNIEMLNEMMKMFPEELLVAFNMDLSSITSVSGWFNTEGYTFLLLVIGLYSSILGSSILLKEESDKTIEFLYSKPINRNKIVTSKILCGLFYIICMLFSITIFNVIGLAISNDLIIKEFLIISLSTLMPFLCLYFISMYISMYFKKTKSMVSISIGIVFLTYFLQILGNMSEKVSWIKYCSLFELSSIRYILLNNKTSIFSIIITVIICVSFVLLIYKKYNKKELV